MSFFRAAVAAQEPAKLSRGVLPGSVRDMWSKMHQRMPVTTLRRAFVPLDRVSASSIVIGVRDDYGATCQSK